jgi:hypothetical protein
MSATVDRHELVTQAGVVGAGLLVGGATAYPTDVPATAVFAVFFAVLPAREYRSA